MNVLKKKLTLPRIDSAIIVVEKIVILYFVEPGYNYTAFYDELESLRFKHEIEFGCRVETASCERKDPRVGTTAATYQWGLSLVIEGPDARHHPGTALITPGNHEHLVST